MYTMKADGVVFYDPSSNDMALQVLSPKAKFELNKADMLSFTMLPGNVAYDNLQKMKTIITLEDDGEVIFRGRVLDTTTDLYNQKNVYCEGELGYLLDSLVRPYTFEGNAPTLFRQLVEGHNSQVDSFKQFQIGTITAITDEDEVKTESDAYASTYAELRQMFVTEFGGYLRVRMSGGVRYLDYIEEYEEGDSAPINFGENLVDIEEKYDAGDVFSVLVPLGGYNTKNKDAITVTEVNGGKDYIESQSAIAKYGRIVKSYKWEELTDPQEILEKGQEQIAKMEEERTLVIKAYDLHDLGQGNRIRLGSNVYLGSSPHGLNGKEICSAVELDIESPDQSEYTFGIPPETLTDSNASAIKKIMTDTDSLRDWLTVTDAELILAKEHISTFGDTISNVRLEMDALNAEIKLIATQHSINELFERVSAAEIEIDGLNAEIKLIATQQTIQDLVNRVTQAEINIDGAEALIEMKASKSEVDEIESRLSQAEIDIDGANAQIALKASKDEMSAMDRRLSQAEVDIDGANAAIALKASLASFEALTARVNQAEIDINGVEASIALKASAEYVNDIERRVSQAEIDIDGMNAIIELKASKDDYDGVVKRLTNAEVAIDGANANIALKADKSTTDALGKRLTQAEADIDGANASINLKASKSDVTALGNRVSSAELRIDGAESAIRAKADLILLDGYVKASELETETLKVVDGATLASLKTGAFNCSGTGTINTLYATGAVVTNLNAPNAILNGSNYTAHSHKITVGTDGTITLGEVSSTGGSFRIADTSFYKDGVSAAKNSVTLTSMGWQGGVNTVTASNGKSLAVNLPAFSVTGGTSWSNNKTTVYFSTSSVNGYLSSKTVDATSVYNSGVTSGKNAVTLSAAGWQGSSNIVSASNGKSVTVSLPTFSVTGGTSWSNNKTTVYFSTSSVNGYLASKTVDASSVYNSGYTAGQASIDTGAYYDEGYETGYAAGYKAAKEAVQVTAGISWSNPAQNYCMIRYWGRATIDGVEVGYAASSESRNISGYV